MDTLTGLLANVGNYAVAVQTQFLGDFGDHGEDVSYNSGIIFSHFGYGSDMRFGDDQKMSGGLRINVIDRRGSDPVQQGL